MFVVAATLIAAMQKENISTTMYSNGIVWIVKVLYCLKMSIQSPALQHNTTKYTRQHV